jgi:hypothetical protein
MRKQTTGILAVLLMLALASTAFAFGGGGGSGGGGGVNVTVKPTGGGGFTVTGHTGDTNVSGNGPYTVSAAEPTGAMATALGLGLLAGARMLNWQRPRHP